MAKGELFHIVNAIHLPLCQSCFKVQSHKRHKTEMKINPFKDNFVMYQQNPLLTTEVI